MWMGCSWQEKLQLSKSTTETCWLSHEIGRCFLELKKYEQVRDTATNHCFSILY